MLSQITASRYLLMFGICEPIMIILIFKNLKLSSKYMGSIIIILFVLLNYTHSITANNNEINLYLPYKNYFLGDTQLYTDPDEIKAKMERKEVI